MNPTGKSHGRLIEASRLFTTRVGLNANISVGDPPATAAMPQACRIRFLRSLLMRRR
ncbi:hypothetical protein [Solilutibacter pythonis]|uniref:hypothetical protein n=1 Tax=Solilutibacter pythonis TaxID=2483112 RepID=UPI0013146A69|nr:hypothetical protein [Lysobacter pythonis]